MDQQETLQKILSKVVQDIFNIHKNPAEIQVDRPRNSEYGDWSTNIAMVLSKELKDSPNNIATQIWKELYDKYLGNYGFKDIGQEKSVINGFINFTFIDNFYKTNVIKEIINKGDAYGKNSFEDSKTYLIEHTSPNPNKEFHLGHLKNNVTGLSISYIVEAMGAKVYRDCIDNNRGIAIAKLMWGYLKFARKSDDTPIDLGFWYEHKDYWFTPEDKKMPPGKFVDALYLKGSDDFKNDPSVEEKVRKLVVDWEAEEPKNHALWAKTQEWVWEGYKKSLTRVNGWKFDQIWHESDIYKKGKEHVRRGLKEGKFKKLEDGAIITDLKKDFGLTDTVLIKNDGTALYITQDLELTYLKRQKFNPDHMMWVIGPEQSLQMKQMFAVCSQLGFGKYEDFHHILYGFILVKGKDGKPEKMSSRNGTQISVNDLIDQAKAELDKYISNKEIEGKEKDMILEKIAIAAIKYSLLKVNRIQDMVFDFNTSVSLEGDSAPYILYTYTRAKSIVAQAGFINPAAVGEGTLDNIFKSEHEIELLKAMYRFPEVVIDAFKTFAPNIIATYIFELAQKFNLFYNSCSVLNAPTEELKNSRLQLTFATAQVLKNALGLLGIETVEKM